MAIEQYIQPVEINWTLPRGDTWPMVFEFGSEDAAVYTPDNLTGAMVRMVVRDSEGLELLNIIPVVTPLTGTVDATQAPGVTNVLWNEAYYELEITYPDGTRRTEVRGTIKARNGGVVE